MLVYATVTFVEASSLGRRPVIGYLELVCPAMQISLMVSPMLLVFDGVRKLNVQDLPLQVFQSQATCNVLGIAYAIQVSNPAVLVTNLFGLMCQTFYLSGVHYVRASNTGWFWYSAKLSILFNAGVYVGIAQMPLGLLGNAITLGNVILYASPLVKLVTVLRTRNATSIPTAYTVVACLNNAIWSVYGMLIPDMVIFLPSFLGLQLALFQLMLILWSWHWLPFDLGYLLLLCPTGHAVDGAPKKEELESKADDKEEFIQLKEMQSLS